MHHVGTRAVGGRFLTKLLVAQTAVALWAVSASAVEKSASVDASRFETVGAEARLAGVLRLVEDSNAPSLVGRRRWSTLVARNRDAIESCRTHAEFGAAVKRLIKSTGISHFGYYTDEDWSYWHLRSAFGGGAPKNQVEHVGIISERLDGRWFVSGILEGSPAENTDIRVGDELLSVDGEAFGPVVPFRGKAGTPVNMRLRRRPGLIYNVTIEPVKASLYREMQRAVRESVSLIVHKRKKFAYLHGWTLLGDGDEYDTLDALQPVADGLILDYRDGFGGTWDKAARFLLGRRDEPGADRKNPMWKKPVVILIADGTRSAKEIVVDAVKRSRRGPLVGEPTPGHVISVGSVRNVGDDGILLLPGHRFELEGNPTTPDYPIQRDIRYCAGKDPQLQMAKQILSDLIRQRSRRTSGGSTRQGTYHTQD